MNRQIIRFLFLFPYYVTQSVFLRFSLQDFGNTFFVSKSPIVYSNILCTVWCISVQISMFWLGVRTEVRNLAFSTTDVRCKNQLVNVRVESRRKFETRTEYSVKYRNIFKFLMNYLFIREWFFGTIFTRIIWFYL